MKKLFIFLVAIFVFVSCNKENATPNPEKISNLTIFFVNDQHGQIDNFSKVKYIIDAEKTNTNVVTVCAGDMFSGNPIVDNYPEKGYPMIDVMNKVGFDITIFGNHEFDYGEANLKNRMEQADFDWLCANIDMGNTGIPEPFEYKSMSVGDVKLTFLGLVETNGKPDDIIPATHPWKVQNYTFKRAENVVSNYANVKESENSDLYIALSHLGDKGDSQLATQFPYFDLIIGGHSHSKTNTVVNNIPVFQAGSYLNYLGKIEITVKERKVESYDYTLIDLNTYTEYDTELKTIIDEYNDLPYFAEVIGYSSINHDKSQVGCFVSDALRIKMNADVTFQNTGGVRSNLNEGDITKREIFEIFPFNNGTIVYDMSVSEIKAFLIGSSSGFYFSGIQIEQIGSEIQISDINGTLHGDNTILSVGVVDYIPAVYDSYFPTSGNVQSLTGAETVVSYLESIDNPVNYENCNRYFRYQ